MKHKPTEMDRIARPDLEIIGEVIQVTCPLCRTTRLEYEKAIFYNPRLTICEGQSETYVEQEIDEDIAF